MAAGDAAQVRPSQDRRPPRPRGKRGKRGITRASFLVRSAAAAGALYAGGAAAPFVGTARAATDVEILNFALLLEYLETSFYEQAKEKLDLDKDLEKLIDDLESDEKEHVDAVREKIEELGGTPIDEPETDFGDAFSSKESFLKLAEKLEEVGLAAYAGAAPEIKSKEVLALAGSILEIEARHVATILLLEDKPPAPQAFDNALGKDRVLEAIGQYVKR